MANKSIFKSIIGKLVPQTDAANEAGGRAYRFSPKHALAQYAATGCLNATFYASAEDQLDTVLKLCEKVEPEFIARTAIYARGKGFMKDLPALLCAALSVKGPGLMAEVFDRVIDDGRMLRNFVQIMRSGAVGRKSLGSLPKRMIQQWLEKRDDAALFRASIGNDPSLADIVRMVHPKPATAAREALYGYLIGRPHKAEDLPQIVKEYEAFKQAEAIEPPDVPFQLLTSLPLTKRNWINIARRAPWQMTRMNLNTFARHGVFEEEGMAELVAKRLSDPELIGRAKVFPYQLLAAYYQADEKVPQVVREAIQDAMEIAIGNVPEIDGRVFVFPDVSGSMGSPVTGYRPGATTAVRCIDVAALVAAAIVRKNPKAQVIPFEQDVVKLQLNPRDSVLTNAKKLAGIGGGGTNCSAPLALINKRCELADLVIYVSDNESWVDSRAGRGTETMRQWSALKERCPKAKLVCIDIQPYGSTQAREREDVLNVGGFSDQVFQVMSLFAKDELNAEHWVGVIESEAI
jgi:60 kDa SS-A/Ro ribonucleoprotein